MALTKEQENALLTSVNINLGGGIVARFRVAEIPISNHYHWLSNDKEYAAKFRELATIVGLLVLTNEAENAQDSRDRIMAAGKLVVSAGQGINISTTVNIENELTQKSDDELDRMIEEDREALLRLEKVKA